ncbi:MAG: N-6 DNA methylase, partial [Vicinamibacterales bacterium]
MIPGFGGHLLPEDFVEARLRTTDARAGSVELQRAMKAWCAATALLGPATGLRALVDAASLPLLERLGFSAHADVRIHREHASVLCLAGQAPVVYLAFPWGAALDRHWRTAVVEAQHTGARWCLLFNGTHLRLVSASRLHSRRHVEITLEDAADDSRAAAALATLFMSAHFDGERDELSMLLADAEQHEASVCRSLRGGVLDASAHVLRALLARERTRTVGDVFEQSLTIVYRLLFLFFAEARGLVPLWHPLYRDSYSVQALRNAALTPGSVGLWDGLRAATRLAHAGCRAAGLTVTAFNGRLFSPSRTPLAESRNLDDAAARQAIIAVSTRPSADAEVRERISYRDLGVEQLGAVYETLLDYEPHVERGARGRALKVSLRPGSGVRKATGTFYTPQSLVDHLLRDTLAPLVRNSTPEQILTRSVLDPSMGSGAFLVGACRYLASAYESALVECGRCHPGDLGPAERAAIRRLVAERCLYGVDINPTAVQLTRLSLWLTTLAADRPLTFLDHHLRVGDSLAGTWLSLVRSAPTPRRSSGRLPLFPDDLPAEALRGVLPVRFSLAAEPNDTAAQVRAKERALERLAAPGSPLSTWNRVADAWCAAWLASPPVPPRAFGDLSDALIGARSQLAASTLKTLLARVDATRDTRRLFHWELEFPEVFFDESGVRKTSAGFDAIVGNPPWDMVRADGEGDRTAARAEASSLVRFARDSGVYEARSDGQANRYQLFVERALALTKPGGRIGLVLPSGIVADAGSASLRRLLFARARVERIVGFDNRRGTFPIHRSVRFVLLSATTGTPTTEIACRFGEQDPVALNRVTSDDDRIDSTWFTTRVTPALLQRVSGDDLSIPDLRSPLDLAIVERAVSLFPPLNSEVGWHARFGRELNATEDRRWMRADGVGAPVFEGKRIEPFRTLPGAAPWHIDPEHADRLLGTRWRRTRLAYRDVASATNRVTLIAALLPAGSVSTHTLFCLKSDMT